MYYFHINVMWDILPVKHCIGKIKGAALACGEKRMLLFFLNVVFVLCMPVKHEGE